MSKTVNLHTIQLMPFIGATASTFILNLVVSFRLSLIPRLRATREIIGTTTYQALYLGAAGMFCRIASFAVVSRMTPGRWYFIGLPFLSILVLIYVHHKYEVKQPKSKKLY